MCLAKNKMDIPEHWNHDPDIKTNRKTTVAILMAYRGIKPPERWQHDSKLCSDKYYTVAL